MRSSVNGSSSRDTRRDAIRGRSSRKAADGCRSPGFSRLQDGTVLQEDAEMTPDSRLLPPDSQLPPRHRLAARRRSAAAPQPRDQRSDFRRQDGGRTTDHGRRSFFRLMHTNVHESGWRMPALSFLRLLSLLWQFRLPRSTQWGRASNQEIRSQRLADRHPSLCPHLLI
jgi:hypothetical protein